jgi:hypothetical protein
MVIGRPRQTLELDGAFPLGRPLDRSTTAEPTAPPATPDGEAAIRR